MNIDAIKNEINSKYLNDYKFINIIEEQKHFFKELLDQAANADLSEYINWLNGILHSLNKEYEKGIEYFKKAIELDTNFMFP